VFACPDRKSLDNLTRLIWRQYNGIPENSENLTRLRIVILARRAAVDRTPER